jgi:hypothetical protein
MRKPRERTLRDLWEVFDRGDHLSDGDLKILISSAESGLRYLHARGERLAASRTAMDLERLRSYVFWRKHGP